jgi:nucleoside-diphosphate-sugar epimerase
MNKRGIYIHISGAGNLMDLSAQPGVSLPKVYEDKSDAEEILSLPPDRPHAAIEQELIRRAAATNTKIAIVSFPMLYGKGRGIFAKHAGHFQLYVQGVLSHGKAFVVGEGANRISTSHVSDASAALVFLIEEALKGQEGRIRWGSEGYYMVETSEPSFKEIAADVAKVLHQKGLIKSMEIDSLGSESVCKIWSLGPIIWGLNARARAAKLKELGWLPSGSSRSESMGAVVDSVLASINSQG